MATALQPTSHSALNRELMSATKRPVSPGPSLLKRPPPQRGDGGPLGGKPQRNMLSTPAQRLQQGPQMVVIQREKPPTFATRVKDGIFIGTVHAALDPGFIFTNKITHIVNCAGANVMNRWEGMGIRYLTFNWADADVSVVLDSKDLNIARICEFMDGALDNAEGVLIHSVRGGSRSATVLIGYLVKKYGWPVDVALDFIRRKRPEINPKPAFVRQLKSMRKRAVRKRNQQKETVAPAEDEIVLKNTCVYAVPAKSLLRVRSHTELYCSLTRLCACQIPQLHAASRQLGHT
jgi:transposase